MTENSPAEFGSVETTSVLVGKVVDEDVGPTAAEKAAGLHLQMQHVFACYYLKVYVQWQASYYAAPGAEKQLIAQSNQEIAATAFPDGKDFDRQSGTFALDLSARTKHEMFVPVTGVLRLEDEAAWKMVNAVVTEVAFVVEKFVGQQWGIVEQTAAM